MKLVASKGFKLWFKKRYPFWVGEPSEDDVKEYLEGKTRKRINKLFNDAEKTK